VIPRNFSLQRLPQGLSALLRGNTLKAKSFKSAGWTVGGFTLQYGLRLVSTLFLTRLLTPEAFGLMSLAFVIVSGLLLLSDIGTTPSIIRSKRGEDPAFLQTAWTLHIVRGGIITFVACLLAWPLSVLYDEPLLLPIVLAISVTALLEGLTSIGIPLARRHMALSKITILDLTTYTAQITVTILLAWYFRSVWALVAGVLFGSMLKVVLSHMIMPPFQHALRWDKETLSEIVTFGRWILLATLLTFLGGRGIIAIQGTMVPIDILGMLAIAGTLAWAVRELAGSLLDNIAFPVLAQIIRERPQDAARTLHKIQMVLILGGVPCFLVLSFIAQDLIGLMYDDRYAMAGPFLSLMALNGALGLLSMPYQNALLAAGESRLHAFIMGLWACLMISAVFIGFHIGGVIGMLAVIGLANVPVLMASALLAWRRGLANLQLDLIAVAILGAAYAITLPGLM